VDTPADAALRAELAANRRLRPDERRAVTRAVFAYYRWLQWLDQRESLQNQVAAAQAWQTRFDKNPASIKPETLAERAVPVWLREEFAPSADYLRQLQREPALWLRTRTGQTAAVARALGDCAAAAPKVPGFEFRVSSLEPGTPNPKPGTRNSELGTSFLATALRYSGSRDLFHTEAFQTGLFEIQDLASQLVGHACAPQPGQTWWDACAGEGGKTLHLADLMQNKGLVWATDRSVRRLTLLQRRTARAQVFNYRSAAWDGSAQLPTKTKFDGILVDAPCSGVGTWQRNPHARWTTMPADVRELAVIQRTLLEHVAPALKPGGRLLYAVCTLTRSETTDIVEAFTAAHPEFEPSPVFVAAGVGGSGPDSQASASGNPPHSLSPSLPLSLPNSAPPSLIPSLPHSLPSRLFLQPHELNANGMFLAAWRRPD
jgi:16S rRNA (cytosine967-C5)-methyltransferase